MAADFEDHVAAAYRTVVDWNQRSPLMDRNEAIDLLRAAMEKQQSAKRRVLVDKKRRNAEWKHYFRENGNDIDARRQRDVENDAFEAAKDEIDRIKEASRIMANDMIRDRRQDVPWDPIPITVGPVAEVRTPTIAEPDPTLSYSGSLLTARKASIWVTVVSLVVVVVRGAATGLGVGADLAEFGLITAGFWLAVALAVLGGLGYLAFTVLVRLKE